MHLVRATDTVNHSILLNRLNRLNRLETCTGLKGTVLKWHLEVRRYFVTTGTYKSDRVAMKYGVRQGSVLGPLLFSLYMLSLGQILQNFNVDYHSYADDTQ